MHYILDLECDNLLDKVTKIHCIVIKDINTKLKRLTTRRNTYGDEKKDYFPMVEADSYGDHAIKYLMRRVSAFH